MRQVYFNDMHTRAASSAKRWPGTIGWFLIGFIYTSGCVIMAGLVADAWHQHTIAAVGAALAMAGCAAGAGIAFKKADRRIDGATREGRFSATELATVVFALGAISAWLLGSVINLV